MNYWEWVRLLIFFPAYICGTVLSTHKLSFKDVIIKILKKIKEEKSVVHFFLCRLVRARNLCVHCSQLQENFNRVLYLLVSKLN